MNEQITARVLRGVIDVPDQGNENFTQQGRAAAFAKIRKARAGEIVVLPVAEFVHLEKLGCVKAAGS
jgi:hypothetical protein